MPPFSKNFDKKSRDYYHIDFLYDGFPGKRSNGKTKAHPIYAVYVIDDYFIQYESTRRAKYKQAIIKVADASLERMQDFKGSLVFWYEADNNNARGYKKHYSGLTQGYLMNTFYSVYLLTGNEKYRKAAYKVFKSLTIPVEKGGVLYRSAYGTSIEEVPLQPNGWILNGWQSSIYSLSEYAKASNEKEAKILLNKNINTMAKLLHLYDAETYANSRYSLSGFTYLKLEFENKDIDVRNINVEVPKEGQFPVESTEKLRWRNFIFKEDIRNVDGIIKPNNKHFRINIVMSRISYPYTNRLNLSVSSKNNNRLIVKIYSGQYSPQASGQVNGDWQELKSIKLAKGKSDVKVDIPWKKAELVAGPTNFNKKLGKKKYNVYHFIHIKRLKEIYEISKNPIFLKYANKWEKYSKQWSSMPIYKDSGVETKPYD